VRASNGNSGVTNTPQTLANAIQPLLRDGLVPATADNDLLILDSSANQVMRLACANASIEDITTALATHGMLADTTGLSRRHILKGAAAAGVVGITVLALPTAAMAASVGLAAPTGVTATATGASGVVDVAWDAVDGATDYEVEYRPSSPPGGEWLTRGLAPFPGQRFTGLANDTEYQFRVFAIAGGTRSLPSEVVSATPFIDPL